MGVPVLVAPAEMARKRIMELEEGRFYKTLLNLMNSSFGEVRYNSAGVIGHLALDG